MKSITKYIGVFILLIGVLVLAIPALQGFEKNNIVLVIGIGIVIGGYLAHIIIGKSIED